jgi:hypothetical protein
MLAYAEMLAYADTLDEHEIKVSIYFKIPGAYENFGSE